MIRFNPKKKAYLFDSDLDTLADMVRAYPHDPVPAPLQLQPVR